MAVDILGAAHEHLNGAGLGILYKNRQAYLVLSGPYYGTLHIFIMAILLISAVYGVLETALLIW